MLPKSTSSGLSRPRLPDSRQCRTSPDMNVETRAWITAQLEAAPDLTEDTARRIRAALWSQEAGPR